MEDRVTEKIVDLARDAYSAEDFERAMAIIEEVSRLESLIDTFISKKGRGDPEHASINRYFLCLLRTNEAAKAYALAERFIDRLHHEPIDETEGEELSYFMAELAKTLYFDALWESRDIAPALAMSYRLRFEALKLHWPVSEHLPAIMRSCHSLRFPRLRKADLIDREES